MLDSSVHLTENSGSTNGSKLLDQLSERRIVFHIRAFKLSGLCLFVEAEFCPILTAHKYQQHRTKIYQVIGRYSLLSLVSISEQFVPQVCDISSRC